MYIIFYPYFLIRKSIWLVRMMIRGFSLLSGYNCANCHFKCCGSEYDLPLFLTESKELSEEFPFSTIFLARDKNKKFLIRGDSCPFLSSKGLCILHKPKLKPIMCRTYPLIFWKFSQNDYLAWINPCRGNGFHWIVNDKHYISDTKLDDMFTEINAKFHSYWGEQIDKNNPFTGITVERIQQEKDFFRQNTKTSLQSKMMEFQTSGSIANKLNGLITTKKASYLNEDLQRIINAVLHWLSWSPVGLQLNFLNSKLIFSIAANWIELKHSQVHEKNSQMLNPERYLNQIGGFLASAILPSFWDHIEKSVKNSNIKEVAAAIRKILVGEIPQQKIQDYLANPQ